MISVQMVSPPRKEVKTLLSAMPVTMPGRAIGRITSSDSDSRPKKE